MNLGMDLTQEQLMDLMDIATNALEAIQRKKPHKVGQKEAADMACEFHQEASRALDRIATKYMHMMEGS